MPKFLEVTDTAAARAALEAPAVYNLVSVKDHGAVGDGVTDDTTAIADAWAAGSGRIYFPPGQYVYNGPGLSNDSPRVIGAGRKTKVILGASSYLINVSSALTRLEMRDIGTSGGLGAIRHTYSGNNVNEQFLVENCMFYNYTECAIATDSADMPYWHIRDCMFWSANTTGTIGLALGGRPAQCVIDACSFVKNKIHIKAQDSAVSVQIKNCDLLQLSSDNSGGARIGIWAVPGTNSYDGKGMVVSGCKFGNENIAAGDINILYADELSGASNGVKMPNLAADSTGVVAGHRISHNYFAYNTPNQVSLIYSTTPNLYGNIIADNQVNSSPKYFLEYKTPPTNPNRYNSSNVIGPNTGIDPAAGFRWPVSNGVGVADIIDPDKVTPVAESVTLSTGGAPAAYVQLSTVTADNFTIAASGSHATKSAATDALGGTNAATYTFSVTSGQVLSSLSAMTPGVPVWVEFDLKNPNDGNALTAVTAFVQDASSHFHWQRTIPIPSVAEGWVSHAFKFVPRTAGTTCRLSFSNNGPELKSFTLGRPRVYHGHERQVGGHRPATTAATTVMGSADAFNVLRNSLISLGLLSGTSSSGSVTTLGEVATIELGHATDTTISRASAGQLAVEGNPLGTKVAVPASAGATGVVGQWAAESGWLYICVAANTWERVAIASW